MNYRLSTAIRLGSLLHPQTTGSLYDKVLKMTCALGAAGDTIYKDIFRAKGENVLYRIEKEWPYLTRIMELCPVCGTRQNLEGNIICLNDRHHWTREEISSWVEKWEDEHGIPRPKLDEISPLVVEEKDLVAA